MSTQSISIMYRHLRELQGLLRRLEDDHPACERIQGRIKEAQTHIAEMEKK